MSYETFIQSVPGTEDKDIMLFTLSTCIWCRKTKALLQELGLAYNYVDVDLLEDADKEEAMKEMWKHNPSTSFPTIVVDGGAEVILGFDEAQIRGLV
jgi:glutaredoxin-like protein NrdH